MRHHGTVLLGPCSKIRSNRRAQPRLCNAETLQDRASAAEGSAVTPHRPEGRNRSSVILSCHLSGVTQSTGRRGKSQLERTRSSSVDLRPRGCSIIRGLIRIHRALKVTAADHMPRLAGPPHRFHVSRRITLRADRSRVAVKLQRTLTNLAVSAMMILALTSEEPCAPPSTSTTSPERLLIDDRQGLSVPEHRNGNRCKTRTSALPPSTWTPKCCTSSS